MTFNGGNTIMKAVYNPNFFNELVSVTNWNDVAKQPLTEAFIEEFKDRLNWRDISTYQKMSIEFLRKHVNDINWDDLVSNRFYRDDPEVHRVFHSNINYMSMFNSMYVYTMPDVTIIEIMENRYFEDLAGDEENIPYAEAYIWAMISKYCFLTSNILKKFANKIYWPIALKRCLMSLEDFNEYKTKYDNGEIETDPSIKEVYDEHADKWFNL